jgi:hypothetical protein
MAKPQEKQSFRERLKQFGQVFALTAKLDKLFLPLVAVAVIVPLTVSIVLVVLGASWMWAVVGVMAALLAVMLVLSMRSNKALMAQAEKQRGSSASIVETMRGDWRVTPAIAATTDFDMVHLVIGRPGVILLGEGDPQRVRQLINQEKKRLAKVIGNADLRDFVIGHDEGQVPLPKLRSMLMKLPRTSTGKDVNALETRLKALTARPQMPRGAIPKNMRPPKGAFRTMRGR